MFLLLKVSCSELQWMSSVWRTFSYDRERQTKFFKLKNIYIYIEQNKYLIVHQNLFTKR